MRHRRRPRWPRLTDAILAVSTDQDPLVAAATARPGSPRRCAVRATACLDALREIDSIGDKTVILLVDQFEEPVPLRLRRTRSAGTRRRHALDD